MGEMSYALCRGCNNFVRRRGMILFRDLLLTTIALWQVLWCRGGSITFDCSSNGGWHEV